jgi:AAA+ superfamily predicted ATPase
MEAEYGRGDGGWLIKECREVDYARSDVKNDELGKKLWEFSGKMIEEAEKDSAVRRALEKKIEEEAEKVKAQKAEKKVREEESSKKGKSDGSRRSRKGNGNGGNK